MIDRQIDDDTNSAFMAGRNQGFEIIERSVLGIDRAVVLHIVFMITGAGHDGHQPEAVIAHVGDVVKPVHQAFEIADSVSVAILIGTDEDFVPIAALRPDFFG